MKRTRWFGLLGTSLVLSLSACDGGTSGSEPDSDMGTPTAPDQGHGLMDVGPPGGDGGTMDEDMGVETTGLIDVRIEGLPSLVKAEVTITGGPGDRLRDVSASNRIEAESGDYVVRVNPVVDGDERYIGEAEPAGFRLAPGETEVVEVTYRLDEEMQEADGQMIEAPSLDGYFGWDVAVDGGVAVIGEPNSGAAHILRRSEGTWSFELELEPEDVLDRALGFFGSSVDIDVDTVVVGAPFASDDEGVVYVYVHEGGAWSEATELQCQGRGNAAFGHAVAVDGDTLIASAWRPRVGAGYLCIFEREGSNGWALSQIIDESIGGDVSLSRVDGGSLFATSRGSVHRYEQDEGIWSGGALDDADMERVFPAMSVDHDGSILVRGHGTWPPGGLVRIQSRSGAFTTIEVSPDDAVPDQAFGETVALHAGRILVGAPTTQNDPMDGSAYLFDAQGNQLQKFIATDPDADLGFGAAVALDGETALVGAWRHPLGGSADQGAAYFFQLSDD